MATIKASRDQFRLDGDKVHHEPTGAWWSTYPDQAHPSFTNAGRLGDVLPNGEEYDEHEVRELALTLLRERL
jgi:hypothetical protein